MDEYRNYRVFIHKVGTPACLGNTLKLTTINDPEPRVEEFVVEGDWSVAWGGGKECEAAKKGAELFAASPTETLVLLWKDRAHKPTMAYRYPGTCEQLVTSVSPDVEVELKYPPEAVESRAPRIDGKNKFALRAALWSAAKDGLTFSGKHAAEIETWNCETLCGEIASMSCPFTPPGTYLDSFRARCSKLFVQQLVRGCPPALGCSR